LGCAAIGLGCDWDGQRLGSAAVPLGWGCAGVRFGWAVVWLRCTYSEQLLGWAEVRLGYGCAGLQFDWAAVGLGSGTAELW